VSERILNGTSAQLGYTVPFTSVHSGNYRTEDKLKQTDNTQKLNITEKKQTTRNTAKQPPWFGRLLLHSAREWGGNI